MNIARLSIRRPIFVASLFILILGIGYLSLTKLPVDLFPNVTFPVVQVVTLYPGAGPSEIETQISKPLEDEISSISGIKHLRSINKDSVSAIVVAFNLDTDIKYAEQQVRDKVSAARGKLPTDAKDPIITRMDPADRPVITAALWQNANQGALTDAQLFDLADQTLRPKLEQVAKVGQVEILGGRKREIRVELDRNQLNRHELSASQIAAAIGRAGKNIPAGHVQQRSEETVYRMLGEFEYLKQLENLVVAFRGNDVPVRVKDLGKLDDTLADESSRSYFNGDKALLLSIYKQSGSNTVEVSDAIKKRIDQVNKELAKSPQHLQLRVVDDSSKFVRDNVDDVRESIYIGIALTLLVVFFFLGNGRSTLITGLALPNSLLGAFILMAAAGFSINIMTLLALSLAVGLLIDDAIVVRENIFRHMEMGKPGGQAAEEGTNEVMLAVVATTLTVLAVFGPISFINGVVGQFFKEFGLTICFAMVISLFDAVTMAPMLSAYLAGSIHAAKKSNKLYDATLGKALKQFERFQDWLEEKYVDILGFTLRRPVLVLVTALLLFAGSLASTRYIPRLFLPAQDFGEFDVDLEAPAGTPLDKTDEMARQVDTTLRKNVEVESTVLIVGNKDSELNKATIKVKLVPKKERRLNTSQFKERAREELKPFAIASPLVKDVDIIGTGMRPFNLNLVGTDIPALEAYSRKVYERLKDHPSIKDPDFSSKPGKPEIQMVMNQHQVEELGISTSLAGLEIRTQVEGATPAVFRENGREYDIRVRVKDDQRDLEHHFHDIYVPNMNQSLLRLDEFASVKKVVGPATINREDRGRYIQISADMNPNGPGMGALMKDVNTLMKGELKPPPGIHYAFVGDAENFTELTSNILLAGTLGIGFIFLVLASLYESFITPLTIMLVLPLAASGAFYALFLTGKTLDLFSMIGAILLLGIATKNSILLVDYTKQLVEQGVGYSDALIQAGRARLRPILMTSFALIAGMLPVAIGLNEASRQRVSMGIAVIGGLISSTLLTLIVVPAAFSYVEKFRVTVRARLKARFKPQINERVETGPGDPGLSV